MIHNKYFEILKQFLGDYAKEIYGRELVGRVKLSQKGIALALEELEEMSILKSRKHGTLKYYRLNVEYTEIRDIIALAELIRKIEFFTRQRKIAYIFKEDDRVIGIFGSYARGIQKQDSDFDIFIIGKRRKNDYDKQGNNMGVEISIKYFPKTEWIRLIKQKNNLCKEIIGSHIIIFGVETFIDLVWRDYYGFS